FRNAPRSADAVAVDTVTLLLIPSNRLEHLVRSNPALALALIKQLAARMLEAEDRARAAEDRAKHPPKPGGPARPARPRAARRARGGTSPRRASRCAGRWPARPSRRARARSARGWRPRSG